LPIHVPSGTPGNGTRSIIVVLGVVALLFFGRPVILPLFLACLAAMALKPLMRGLSAVGLPPSPAAAIVCLVLLAGVTTGFVELGRPVMRWVDDAPQNIANLRTRFEKRFPNALRVGHALDAMSELGDNPPAKKDGDKTVSTVEIREKRGTGSILNWTGTALAGLGETFVLIYLLLASGDMFMQKLVRVMPTLRDKKRAVEISHEVQLNISNYLFSVSLINTCLGGVAAAGFYFLGVPRAGMWGVLAAILNFVPYFGPVLVIGMLGIVGMTSFDTMPQCLMPACWYLILHLLESNFVTPILLGRRLTLNPVAIFVSIIFWFWLWGIPGALIAVPVLVSVKAACDRIPQASYISEIIGN
jgi:predicted PurR-regulated permease PerM